MNAGGTLLIDALLGRLSAAEAKMLLEQIDRSIAQNAGPWRPAQAGLGRRRSDNHTHNPFPQTTTPQPSKDSLS